MRRKPIVNFWEEGARQEKVELLASYLQFTVGILDVQDVRDMTEEDWQLLVDAAGAGKRLANGHRKLPSAKTQSLVIEALEARERITSRGLRIDAFQGVA